MAESISGNLWQQSLGTALLRLRERGQSKLKAALAPAQKVAPPELPGLQGEALARHHIALAIEALRKPSASKPHVFRELRLLINKFEQGTGRPEVQCAAPSLQRALPAMNRRTRLLSRAFESANSLAAWRAPAERSGRQQRTI